MKSSTTRHHGPTVKDFCLSRLRPEQRKTRKAKVMELERQCILECVKEKARQLKTDHEGWRGWTEVKQALGSSTISTESVSEVFAGSDDSDGSCGIVRSDYTLFGDELVPIERLPDVETPSNESSNYTFLFDDDVRSLSLSSRRSKPRFTRLSPQGKYYYLEDTSDPQLTMPIDRTVVSELKHSYISDQTTMNDLMVEIGSTKEQLRFRRSSSLAAKHRMYFGIISREPQEIESYWPGRKKISKNEADSRRIVRRFSRWAVKRGLRSVAIDHECLNELFQLQNSDSPAVCSLRADLQELLSVPDEIPGCPAELKGRAAVYRQVLYDQMYYERKNPENYFLSKDPRSRKKPDKSPVDRWFGATTIPPDLFDSSALLEPLIVEFPTVVENFVSWILETPDVRVPKYLVKTGLVTKVLEKMDTSTKFPTKRRLKAKNRARRRIVSKIMKAEKLFYDTYVPRLSEIYDQTVEESYHTNND